METSLRNFPPLYFPEGFYWWTPVYLVQTGLCVTLALPALWIPGYKQMRNFEVWCRHDQLQPCKKFLRLNCVRLCSFPKVANQPPTMTFPPLCFIVYNYYNRMRNLEQEVPLMYGPFIFYVFSYWEVVSNYVGDIFMILSQTRGHIFLKAWK